jgi:hypothetical protein
VVAKQQGKGQVVAMLTAAGSSDRKGVGGEDLVPWNNWGAGSAASYTYPMFGMNLMRFLVRSGLSPNRTLGERVELFFDPARYAGSVKYTFLAQPDMDQAREGVKVEPEAGEGAMTKAGKDQLVYRFQPPVRQNVRRPGLVRLALTLKGAAEDEGQELRAFVFNVDAEAESDLRRATREGLELGLTSRKQGAGVRLHYVNNPDDMDLFKEKQPDASESPWLFLFFLIILIVEQAMAVHLSFHLKASEAPLAPARAPAAAA